MDGNDCYFAILLYIDHKKFDFKYNFYEIKYADNLKKAVSKIETNQKIEVVPNLEDIKNS